MISYIYALTHPGNPRPYYVGRTGDMRRRLYEHLARDPNSRTARVAEWVRALLSCGVRPVMTQIEQVDSTLAEEAERRWINFYGGIYPGLLNHCPTPRRMEAFAAVFARGRAAHGDPLERARAFLRMKNFVGPAPAGADGSGVLRLMSAACHARDHAKVSAVSKHAGIARTTLYHAISDPSSVGVGTADKIIAAVNAVCGKGF